MTDSGHLGRDGFFWLHIKKAGGTSFREAFSPPYVQTDRKAPPRDFSLIPRQEWNDTVNNYRYPLGEFDFRRMLFVSKCLYAPDEFSRIFKFVIVRNPYDRAVSCWRYRVAQGFELDSGAGAFERFLEGLPENWHSKANRHLAMHSAPIWPDITDGSGRLLVDRIYRLEEIELHLPEICASLGVDQRSLPRRNSLSGENHPERLYTKHIRSIIERIYNEDLNGLGYDYWDLSETAI